MFRLLLCACMSQTLPPATDEHPPHESTERTALLADDESCNVFGMTSTGRLATREDITLNRTAQLEYTANHKSHCSLAYRLNANYTWLHVPKCGSSWIEKTWPETVRNGLTSTETVSALADRAESRSTSFAISRDPTERVVSAFHQVIEKTRKGSCWPKALPFINEPSIELKFLGMLRMMRDVGPRLDLLAACPPACAWHHTWSQSLFLFRATGLPPLRREHLIRLDRLSTELPAAVDAARHLPPDAYNATVNARSTGERNETNPLLRLPGVLQFVAEYYKQDFACLGYDAPKLGGLHPTMWAI